MREICECIGFVLTCGANGAQPFSGNEGWRLKILGGAIDKERSWPMMFDLNLHHRGQDNEYRATILEGMVSAISAGIMESMPSCLSAADPFGEFCDSHLERVLSMGMNNASLWCAHHNFQPDILEEAVFKDVMEIARKTLLLVGRLFKTWDLEDFSSYQISDVMMEMWKLRKDGYEDEVSKAFDPTIDGFTMENDFLKGLMDEYRKGEGFTASAAERARSLRKGTHWIHDLEEDEEEREEVIRRIEYEFPRHPT